MLGGINSLSIPEKLLEAYNNTTYIVLYAPSFILSLGRKSESLLSLYKVYDVDSSVFITSFNPKSVIQSLKENSVHMTKLENVLKEDYSIFPGIAVDPLGKWPEEKSYLALGVTEHNARKIGMAFNQNAVVWCANDGVPRLLTCIN